MSIVMGDKHAFVLTIRFVGPPSHPTFTHRIKAPFHEGFNAALKDAVPFAHRAWDGKFWWVSPSYESAVRRIGERYFKSAYLEYGDEVLNLHTGDVYEQGRLF